MPIPYVPPPILPGQIHLPGYPEWLPDPKMYAVEQERWRHDQALNSWGEYAMFVLMWDLDDLEGGRVGRCPTCYMSYGKIAEVYQQPSKRDCPDCYGTTFEGGIKAKIVRTSLWNVTEEEKHERTRGQDTVQTATVQSTSDFVLRTGDYIFRADGTRWQARNIATSNLLTGFQEADDTRTAVGYNYANINLEDPASVSYLIPPDGAALKAAIDLIGVRYPPDFSALEEIHGPLVPT